MSMWLRYATASQEMLLGPFVSSSNGNTPITDLVIAASDIKIWREGAIVEASKNNGGAFHIASGRYYCVLDDTDTGTLGKIEINIHVSGALPVRREFMVVPANVYDSLILGTDYLTTSGSSGSGDGSSSLITASEIAELGKAPKKTVTDEGSVEERSIDELIKADQYAKAAELEDDPLHGLRISRFKPAGPQ